MLARLGVKVVKRAEGGNDGRGPGDEWFGVGTGEAVEFGEPSAEDKKNARRLYA